MRVVAAGLGFSIGSGSLLTNVADRFDQIRLHRSGGCG
jgi:hypothetical protein